MAAVLSITSINMVKADAPKPATVAILDTALNAKLPEFKDKIVQEVCILEWNSCANGQSYMEGPGAASMPLKQMIVNGFDHGTKMTSTQVLTNPNIKVVFIRIIGATPTGVRQIANENTFLNAFNWIISNKDKYNIQAVALSQGHGNFMPGSNYCPTTPNTVNAINSLDSMGIPVFVAAGNNRDLNRIFWPSCIPSSIAVSASSVTDGIAVYSNYDKNLTDMFANGRLKVTNPEGYYFFEDGTSISAQVAAAIYMGLKTKYTEYSKQQILDLMKSKSYPVKNKTIPGYIVSKDILNG